MLQIGWNKNQFLALQKFPRFISKTKLMLKRISSISDDNCPTFAHYLYARVTKTMKSTAKADKYARLIANVVKLIRTATPETKSKYSKTYKQLLVLRQVFRWQGMYEAILEISQKGSKAFQWSNLPNMAFILFQMFGDSLDRMMFYIEILGLEPYKNFYNRIDQLESDCYFIGCFIWLQFHLRTLPKTWREGTYTQKKVKILKIVKYLIDSITSYNKFSKRIWELQPKKAAILGIISSFIGLYQLLQ